MRLYKILIFAFLCILAACNSGSKKDIVAFVPDIPTSTPTIPDSVKFDADAFPTLVEVEYKGDTVLLSDLPQGVAVAVKGADVDIYNNVDGVEVLLKGATRNGSLRLTSNSPILLSLNSLALFAESKNAITVVAPKGVYLRGVGKGANYVLDVCKSDDEYVAKNSAAIRVDGNVMLLGGNLAVKGGRMSAIHCSGKMFFDDMNFAVEAAKVDAIVADSGIVVAGGNIAVSGARDAFKSKRGNMVVLGGGINIDCSQEKGDGVQARNFYLYGGNIEIKTSGAAARGVNSKGAIYLMDGGINISTSGDAVFSPKKADYTSASCLKSGTHTYINKACVVLDNSATGGKCINCDGMMQIDGGLLSIKNTGDDIQHPLETEAHSSAKGVKCDSSMLIKGGVIDIRVFGKGERCEGLEAKGRMILGGNVAMNIFAFDDAINAGDDLIIEGGRIFAYSVANDGIDANAKLSIKGGTVIANGTHAPEQGVDTDGDSRFDITGGTLIAIGGSMGPSPTLPRSNATTQPLVACTGIELVRGRYVALCNAEGAVINAYMLPRTLVGGAVTFSSPAIALGESYSVVMCDTVTGARNLGNGLFEGGTVTGKSIASWVQEKLMALVSANGSVSFIDKLAAGDNGGRPMPPPPPFGGANGDNGGRPMPPPPPFGGVNGDNGGRPMPPPPPFGGANGDNSGRPMPLPPPHHFDNEGYGESNVPGGGWAPIR